MQIARTHIVPLLYLYFSFHFGRQVARTIIVSLLFTMFIQKTATNYCRLEFVYIRSLINEKFLRNFIYFYNYILLRGDMSSKLLNVYVYLLITHVNIQCYFLLYLKILQIAFHTFLLEFSQFYPLEGKALCVLFVNSLSPSH